MIQSIINNKSTIVLMGILTVLLIGSITSSSIFAQPSNTEANSTTISNQSKASSSFEGGIVNKTLSSPLRSDFAESVSPPVISEEEKKQKEEAVEGTYITPELPISNKTIEGPTKGSETEQNATTSLNSSTSDNTQNRSVPINFTPKGITMEVSNNESNNESIVATANKTLSLPSVIKSSVFEPSLANNGETIFYTANWFAARSTDGGTTWNYLDPSEDFTKFCCDQLVIFDPHREIFVWFRQGVSDKNGENIVKLSISKDANRWWTYNIKPTDFDPTWTGQWFDYAHFSLGDKYLYVTTNMYDVNREFIRSVIAKISLDNLANAVAPSFSSYYDSSGDIFTFTPVTGAKDTMYWASHITNSKMRIYSWPENQSWTQITKKDIEIPAWTRASTMGMQCNSPDNNNMCGRADSRITAGWISGDTIGFFWNADKGGRSIHGETFNWPYINSATFNVSNMKYEGRPYIWSPDFAFLYGSAYPSDKGDIGIEVMYGGGNKYPSIAVGIADRISGNPPPWDLTTLMVGTNAPVRGETGDYLATRAYNGPNDKNAWISGAFTLQGCGTDECIEPRYFVFERESGGVIKPGIIPSFESDMKENTIYMTDFFPQK
jgi:hypothetical protein